MAQVQPPPRPVIRKESTRTRPSVEMATIIHKLKWAKEWSVSVSPEEAVILSRLIDDYFSRLNERAD